MNILSNAFSLQMITNFPADVHIEQIEASDIPQDVISCIGHTDTANVLSDILGFNIPCNRQSITVDTDTTLYVAQVTGGRLPEGATTLPDGCDIRFMKVSIN